MQDTGFPEDHGTDRRVEAGGTTRIRHLGWLLLVIGPVVACSPDSSSTDLAPPDPPHGLELTTQVRFSGLVSPVLVTHAGDSRLFVVEQPGRIRVTGMDGELRREPYLDITELVGFGGERGLLSMAFHPDFAHNGYLYVSYTDKAGTSRVVRYTEAGSGLAADPSSPVPVLDQAQPFGNHNGGHLAFGPGGQLFVALGDGGSGGDPLNSGQDTSTLLGSLLRLDVDRDGPGYAVPADNPFVGQPGALDEIWAFGLRNPWRFSFDPQDNRLYVADVGQNSREEVSVVAVAPEGYNFGWRLKEGDRCFQSSPCDDPALTDPLVTYSNPDEGCSVTGGLVYRGGAIPGLVGTYLYADFCGGWIRGFRLVDGSAAQAATWLEDVGNITSFGQDQDGEIYVTLQSGQVLRILEG